MAYSDASFLFLALSLAARDRAIARSISGSSNIYATSDSAPKSSGLNGIPLICLHIITITSLFSGDGRTLLILIIISI
ncbi:hypothetical protein [Duncaniella freteri]|uniref:hypothetical protein n=1 Tax=Duncaniella freteri TaxID=2530391 RepID=UPI002558313D|nr:hypothetical protein [Duncaniella freteri]